MKLLLELSACNQAVKQASYDIGFRVRPKFLVKQSLCYKRASSIFVIELCGIKFLEYDYVAFLSNLPVKLGNYLETTDKVATILTLVF